ncbi:MAG TPA: hypothetical protein VKD19_07635, partial [Pseudolabrys sp.]|nr:hypothetical protein [Pseudolabrys sp.]
MIDARRPLIRLCVLVVPCALAAMPAFAAEGARGPSEFIFVAQLALLMLVGRLLGEVMIRFKQPGVMGQLIAGLLTIAPLRGSDFEGDRYSESSALPFPPLGRLRNLLFFGNPFGAMRPASARFPRQSFKSFIGSVKLRP